MNPTYIIKHPIITEKTLLLTAQHRFTFVVDRHASKDQIGEAIKTAYKVNVVSVRTSRLPKTSYRASRKSALTKYRPAGKKAIVELQAGQKIDLFDIKQQ